MLKTIAFLLLITITLGIPTGATMCKGTACGDGCGTCTNLCDPTQCLPSNNCRCPTTDIPGDIPQDDTPQFIFLTFDDSVSRSFFERADLIVNFFGNEQIKDSFGCKVRPTFYTMSEQTDYDTVHSIDKYGEIGLHSVTHSVLSDSTPIHVKEEFRANKEHLLKHGKISDIKSSRVPILAYTDNYFKAITEIGITIDSSVPYGPTNSKRYWPFTLDYGFPKDFQICNESGPTREICPEQTYEGLWEIPMHRYFENGAELFDMDPPINSEVDLQRYLKIVKDNFEKNYQGNRAPIGLYFHYFWLLSDEQKQKLRTRFIQESLQYFTQNHRKVVFATPKQVIEWVKNPKPFSELKQQCAPDPKEPECENGQKAKECKSLNYKYYFHTCDVCPEVYPGIDFTKTCGDGFCAQDHHDLLKNVESCDCSDCNNCGKTIWKAVMEVEEDKYQSSKFCLNFKVTNTEDIEAGQIYLFGRFANAAQNKTWGNRLYQDPFRKINEDFTTTFIAGAEQGSYPKGKYSIFGSCFNSLGEITQSKDYDVSQQMVFMAYFINRNYFTNFDEKSFPEKCGNGVCDDDESETLCPFDCKKIEVKVKPDDIDLIGSRKKSKKETDHTVSFIVIGSLVGAFALILLICKFIRFRQVKKYEKEDRDKKQRLYQQTYSVP